MPSRFPTLSVLLLLLAGTPLHLTAEEVSPATEFQQTVLPILTARCGHCHGADLQEGQLRFDTLSLDLVNNRAAAQHWRDALHALNAGKMPPEDERPLPGAERETLTAWISAAIDTAIRKQRSTGGRPVLRRLNRLEYQNTMQDLLGLEMNYQRDLPPDAVSPDGFRNDGQSLQMSAIQLEYYLDTARRALDRVLVHSSPPTVFRHRFESSNVDEWRGPTEASNRLERAQKFLVRIRDHYPEQGEFRIRVRLRAELKPNKGFPLLEVAVGYRPDTEVHFGVAEVREIYSEDLQQLEFRGRMENFPLPVRGQGKYPGLVIRLRNLYDDGTPIPHKLETVLRDGKEVKAFRAEPEMPALLIESLEFEGPFYTNWPPEHHRRILFASELRDRNEVAYLREVLRRFMTRAYRRPATAAEVESMFAFFASIRPHFTRFEDAVRETLAYVLIQPHFLYLLEDDSPDKRQVDDWELASRLSYFLWSTMPDERLLDLAKQGALHEPVVLQAEVRRMLQDHRAQRFTTQFVNQWLNLEQLESMAIDAQYYPQFRDELKDHFRGETVEFLRDLIATSESAMNLLDSDYMMVNEPLARHYGIGNVWGQRFRRVPAVEHRGGLLAHASILLINSSGQDSHPIRRAVWIRDRLLNDPPPPPPPDAPALDATAPAFAKLSVREQLELHRQKESCASCHRNIDPWGIALENYDAVGIWRDSIRKKVGDTFEQRQLVSSDVLPNGFHLDGPDSLKTYLSTARQQQFARALVRAIVTYALGRTLELSDEAEIDALTEQFTANGHRLDQLIQDVVGSEAFRTK